MTTTTFHAAMFPWFAFGHLLPFLHLANKLAKRGHRVAFLLPTKARTKLETFNFYPNLIHFVPLVVPHVDGLPPGAETMSDVPIHMGHLLLTAMARMQDQVEATLSDLKPDLIFLDTAHWIPALARRYGMKSIHHCIVGATSVAHHLVPARYFEKGKCTDLMLPPSGFPSSSLELHIFETRPMIEFLTRDYFDGMTFSELIMTSMKQCDAISFRTCRELEGPFCDYIESQHGKPVLLAGPTLPELPASPLEERWVKWLGGFKTSSVVYCALGSECVLKKEQFQELALGLELTGLPFLAALKPPVGAATVEEALPKGFEERVRGRGVVHGGWVQQTLILGHPSVGCFVTHCGFSSTWESLMSDCQLVLLPHVADQFLNARLLSRELKVAVEVERREEDGWFTRKDVCKAVKLVMDDDSKVGSEMRENHGKWMEILLKPGFESSYINSFVEKLQDLINSNKSDSGEWRPRLYQRPPVG